MTRASTRTRRRDSFADAPTSNDPSARRSGVWSPQDDAILLAARAQGLNWDPIAELHFPGKSGNACRKRHERVIKDMNEKTWDGKNLDRLALEYMGCRETMWTILGVRLGEDWRVLEKKCFSVGLKTIQSTFNSIQRAARGMDDDSGVGFSDAEHEVDASPPEAGPSTAAPQERSHRGGLSIQAMLSPSPPQGPSS
ncbi:hypothetical protein K402DRAFT_321737 [Aulographum hederae CBS 113979]|uniref:Myb-like domain-containing protein n=1 Tax=Aulographum hederae CBS 113979 TaxID=1176131 RepID=A0A6G1HGG4_9PEZI|nr:hypothetical protein K402DRAFT_321737 [Aulographum hederae CBS 113979]